MPFPSAMMMRLLVVFPSLCVACHHTAPCAVNRVIFVVQFVLPAVVSSLPLVAVPCISGRPEKGREIRGTRGGLGAGAPWGLSMPVRRISSADCATVPLLALRCAYLPGDTTRQAHGNRAADCAKAAGDPGRGPQRHPLGTPARCPR